ncbi:MAG: nucleotidyltransferase domain-containing protein [Fibromonadaceae bacterium]|jgi:predicted nucleotidyltransferase|nr:nucleotidyltransferase domain-containing protein [Fibromonadaceae bacterium]
MSISKDLSREICSAIKERMPNVLAIYAFGSQISGFANSKSDLDLAVLVEGYADPVFLWDLASGKLADIAKMPVDLLDMRAASTVMQHQILATGSRLYEKDSFVNSFESFVFREKFDLDDKRAELFNDIKKRGSVYG